MIVSPGICFLYIAGCLDPGASAICFCSRMTFEDSNIYQLRLPHDSSMTGFCEKGVKKDRCLLSFAAHFG